MAQDIDVARVAAALRAPVIRYRNFGNVPVRGTFQPSPAESAPEITDLDAALAEAAALQLQEEARSVPAPALQPPVLTDPHLDTPSPPQPDVTNQPEVEKIDIAAVSWADSSPSQGAVQPEVVTQVPVVPLPPQMAWTPPIPAPMPALAPPAEERPLLELLREAALQPATAQHGLLALLAQPAIWDRPAAPQGMVPGPLSGQPIATDTGGLLSSAGFGAAVPAPNQPPVPYQDVMPHPAQPQPFTEPPAFVPYQEAPPVAQQPDFVSYQEPPQPFVRQTDFVPYQEPSQPFMQQPAYAPYQDAPQPVAQQPDFAPYQEPPQPFVQQPAYVSYQDMPQPVTQQPDFAPYQEPPQPFVQQPAYVPYQEPPQPFMQQPAYAPYQNAPQPVAQQPDFAPYQEPPQPFVQQPAYAPYQDAPQPYAPQPEAPFQPQPAAAPAASAPAASATPLADVFRRVRTSAVQPAEAKQTVALHNVLRGLRAGRQD